MQVLNEIINSISQSMNIESGNPYFGDKRYSPYPLSKDNFSTIKEPSFSKKMSFIDGGNQQLYSCPSFALHLVRVYFNIFQDNQRVEALQRQRYTFYVLSHPFVKDREIFFRAKSFSLEGNLDFLPQELEFFSKDKKMIVGGFRAKIDRACTAFRRFAERLLAIKVMDELEKGDVIIWDGTLQSSVTGETEILDKVYEQAEGINITALAKTSRLYTDTGANLTQAIRKIAPSGKWLYYPVADIKHPDHRAKMFFVRLNENSRYIFRFEHFNQQKNSEEIISLLAQNSKDITFPGYPYGLIDVDKFARVTNQEANMHASMLKAGLGKDVWKNIKKDLSSSNAHSILDGGLR